MIITPKIDYLEGCFDTKKSKNELHLIKKQGKSTFCVCDTIEEARVKRDECNKNDKRPYTDYHILVYGDEEFGGNPYRTE